jgi:N-acetylglucosamine-6-phosphate deacetylase
MCIFMCGSCAQGADSVTPMSQCVRNFKHFTGTSLVRNTSRCRHTQIRSHMDTECSTVEALQAATLHPAQLLGIRHRKGTLDVGADADLVVLDDDLNVRATFVRGALVYKVGA